jgi:hypothetical protein
MTQATSYSFVRDETGTQCAEKLVCRALTRSIVMTLLRMNGRVPRRVRPRAPHRAVASPAPARCRPAAGFAREACGACDEDVTAGGVPRRGQRCVRRIRVARSRDVEWTGDLTLDRNLRDYREPA